MSDLHYKLLMTELDRISTECDTREKAVAQLQSEGLLDAKGETAPLYRPEAQA